MSAHAEVLIQLATELFPNDQWARLFRIAGTNPFDRHAYIEFDDGLWGPSLSRIADNRPNAPGTLGILGHGITRCEVEDRAVFKPLHYCSVCLTDPDKDLGWETRRLVEMSSAHLEQLVKKIGPLGFLAFGNLLRQAIVKQKVDPVT